MFSAPILPFACFIDYNPDSSRHVVRAIPVAGIYIVARPLANRRQGANMGFALCVRGSMLLQITVACSTATTDSNHIAQHNERELVAHRIDVDDVEPNWIDESGEHGTSCAAAGMKERVSPRGGWARLGIT